MSAAATARADIRLYRVAHGKLLPSLVARGLLCRRAVHAEGIQFQTISNEEIEAKRAATAVPCGPGGTLHDYVPFHFGPRSPMMSRISYRNLPAYTRHE
jgi:ssDNA thymidine ADP-ribosyltransferase, DarT